MPAQDCPLRKPPTRRVAAALAGCGDGKQELTAGEVQRALAEVPYAVQLQPTQRGENENGEVITGTAKDRDGTRLGFAVAVGGADMPRRSSTVWATRTTPHGTQGGRRHTASTRDSRTRTESVRCGIRPSH